ncbi:MAG TPA: hypothetical protein DDW52_16090 [Planctomycetaceae bacterium]|nr:hypothetical protein [Planctomycetaceae bacterium]
MTKRSKSRRNAGKQAKGKKPDPRAKQKLAAIPLLLAILGYVVYSNFQDADAHSQPTTTATRPSSPLRSATETTVNVQDAPLKWPEVSTDFLVHESPLANYLQPAQRVGPGGDSDGRTVGSEGTATPIARQVSATEAAIVEELASQSARFVMKTSSRDVALIGDRIISSGQQLNRDARLESVDGKRLVIRIQRPID